MHGIFFEPPIEQNFIAWIMEEVYKTKLFEPFLPKKIEGSVVLDLGANIGITSYYFSSRFETVYAIEPAQEHMDVLKYMVEFNKIENIKPFQFALSMYDKPSESFYHYNNKTMYSLYPNLAQNNPTGLQATGEEKVELKRIDTFMKENNIEHVDLLKMDIEGIEFEFFGSESFTNIASKIDCIVGEIHTYAGRNPNQIFDALRIQGFEVGVVPNDATLFWAKRK